MEGKICVDQFELLEMIGQGQTSQVYKVREKKTGQIYAAKISLIDLDGEYNSKDAIRNLVREVNILCKFSHPSIVKFYGFDSEDNETNLKTTIIQEFMPKGTLTELIEAERNGFSHPKWDSTRKLICLYGIASAMSFLHSHNIIHRDLKPDNIFIDNDLNPKIGDFGLSKIIHFNDESKSLESSTGFKGTILYSSPEALFDGEYTKSGDVYSFSMIIYEIITNEKPFGKLKFSELTRNLTKGERPKFNDMIPDAYKDLIDRCWSQEPLKRPTFDQIVEELRSNPDFITDLVDEGQYMSYIDYIDECKSTFEGGKQVLTFNEFYQAHLKKKESAGEEDDYDADFLFSMWRISYHGIGRPVNKAAAFDFCRRAANKGHVEAMFQASMMLKNGDGIPANEEESAEYCKMAADQGHADAMYCYSMMLKNGKGIPADKKGAAKYCKMAADQGHGVSMDSYAVKLFHGSGVSVNKKEAAKYFKMAADKGIPKSMFSYANSLYRGDVVPIDKKEAAKYYKMAADKGHPESMFNYANSLYRGDVVPIDKKEAAKYFKMAADKGIPKSMFSYANSLYRGDVVPIDKKEAAKYFKMAADKGIPKSMFSYANSLYRGDGVPIDKKEAAKYYKMAADHGSKSAMKKYAEMLSNGDGVPANEEEAQKYLKMASGDIKPPNKKDDESE
ncbi:hypothetical protein M9Y10_033232 [Tritrichomonas musculus]|uniref:Protein kinase domain-containing protein n=1 Tax=Tritrichomonas musculus TaxID=1915356 RepID=A0ABR2GXF3_9EUKA